jgi:hypothetical protein
MNHFGEIFIRPPFFSDEVDGFVVAINSIESVLKTFNYFVFSNLSDAALFASEYRKLNQLPTHWDRRTLGDVVVRRSTETERHEGHFFSTLEEYNGRKVADITFISKLNFTLVSWTIFDNVVTEEKISKITSMIDRSVVSHIEDFKDGIVNENNY